MELLNRFRTFRALRRPGAGLALTSLALLLLLGFPLPAQSAGEYELKAAFLSRFASFVEWPDAASNGPPCIGVLGEDPFGPALDEAVKGKSYHGRGFEIRRFKPGQESNQCQILFIGALEPKKLCAVLGRLKGVAVLTVGDVPGFGESGGMVNLGLAGDKVQLEINVEAAATAGLHLSSRLLSLARIVRAGQGGR
jgi:YfiR/HmsC-like